MNKIIFFINRFPRLKELLIILRFKKLYNILFKTLNFLREKYLFFKISKLIRNDAPVILEVGANNGSHSKMFLKLFKNIKLYCFEPDLRAISKFKKNINDQRCELFEFAISNKNGEAIFYLSGGTDMENGWDLSSSIKKPKKHLERAPNITFKKKRIIKTVKLDTWAEEKNIKQIDFIWADVQGAERELIEGGINTFNKKVRYLYTEFDNEEVYEGQPNLKEICSLLPNFKILGIFENNVLLKNKILDES